MPISDWDQILPIVERRLEQDGKVAQIAMVGMAESYRKLELTIDILRRRYPESGIFSDVMLSTGDVEGSGRYTVGLLTSSQSDQISIVFGSWSIDDLDIALSQCMAQLEGWLKLNVPSAR